MADKVTTKQTEKTEDKKYIAEVITGALNVRKSPSLDADIVTFIRRGLVVDVIQPKVNKGWIKIATQGNDKITGYVMKEFVKVKEAK